MASDRAALLRELRSEHRRRVFDRLERRNTGFTTLFSALLAFALVFFALVQIPYMRLGEIQATLGDRVAALNGEVTLAVQRITTLRTHVQALIDLRDDSRAALEAESDPARRMRWANELGAAETELADGYRRVEEEEAALEKRRSDVETQRKATDEERVRISDRLRSIQTPFGLMPIGASDGLLAFPIVIAIGFLIASLLLADAARLKREFRRLCRDADPDGDVTDDDELMLVAPLWFDAARPVLHRLGLMLVYACPAAIFIGSVTLIVIDWNMAAVPLARGEMQRVYAIAYAFAFALLGIALWRVRQAFAQITAGA